MVNVPSAVWINETGRIVRPAESTGATDGFRTIDRATFQMPAEVAAAGKQARKRYIDALRDWIDKGDASLYALSPEDVRQRMPGMTEMKRWRPPTFASATISTSKGIDTRHTATSLTHNGSIPRTGVSNGRAGN